MSSVTVECQKRPEGSESRALRRDGLIPANLYGHQGAESLHLVIEQKTAERMLRQAALNNTIVNLNVPDLKWQGPTLLREVQTHPWKLDIYHISFFAVRGRDAIDVVVPVSVVGEAEGVKEGGVLEQLVTELAIQCDPSSIPDSIEIDVTAMGAGATLHASELKLPEGATISAETDIAILSIVAPSAPAPEPSEELAEEEPIAAAETAVEEPSDTAE